MLYTLADARDMVKKYVDGGSCSQLSVDARINECLERLTDAHDLECMRKFVKINTCNDCITLPYCLEKIMWVDVNGVPGRVFGTAYQFLSSGPGDLDCRGVGSSMKFLVDKGDDWPVMRDIPSTYDVDGTSYEPDGLRLVAFCEQSTDAGKFISVSGYDSSGREINPTAAPSGEQIVLNQWQGGVRGEIMGEWDSDGVNWTLGTNAFAEVSRVSLPTLTGTATLYAFDTVNDYFFYLAEYHPSQGVLPQFRRYGLVNRVGTSRAHILALAKLRRMNLVNETDIVPVDSLQALKLMAIAISEENKLNIQGAVIYEERAKAVMANREKSRTMADGTPTIFNRDFRTSLGRHLNHSRIV